MNKELGKRISSIVETKGIKKNELAQDIGVSQSALSKYLSGAIEPNARVLANIATALECSVDSLLNVSASEKPLKECELVFLRNRDELTKDDKLKLIDIILKNNGKTSNEIE